MAGWGIPSSPWKKPVAQTRPPQRRNNQNFNIANQALDYSTFRPSDPRSPAGYINWQLANGAVRNQALTGGQNLVRDYTTAFTGARANPAYPVTQPIFPMGPGGPGGGGPAGLDQATFDWLMAQLQNKPQGVGYRPLDLPDPSQYMKWDPSQYGVARQGVTQGIEGIRGRGNEAFNTAVGELNRYQNPYAGGLRQVNPDLYASMARMTEQAGPQAQQAIGQTFGEGVQADRAMGNMLAMMAGTDQARQAANLRATEADRRMMEQNLGIEGNMLGLGVNMAEAKAKTAFDQALQNAMYGAASQEATSNWGRQNEVEATNAATWNDWMNNTLQQILGLVGQKAPGTALPGDMSWLNFMAPGMNIQAGSQPIPAKV